VGVRGGGRVKVYRCSFSASTMARAIRCASAVFPGSALVITAELEAGALSCEGDRGGGSGIRIAAEDKHYGRRGHCACDQFRGMRTGRPSSGAQERKRPSSVADPHLGAIRRELLWWNELAPCSRGSRADHAASDTFFTLACDSVKSAIPRGRTGGEDLGVTDAEMAADAADADAFRAGGLLATWCW
jgi:hypothetical protein